MTNAMTHSTAHVIPEALVDRIKKGRAALVIGSNIGALAGRPSWKKLLERLAGELEKRGKAGDAEAAGECQQLLKKGRIVAAARFLSRTLGGERCDAVLAEAWATPDPLPEAIKVLGRVPVRAIWTVHPLDLVEQAVTAGSPEGWPEPKVATYADAAELDPRRRHVLKLLGDVKSGTYVVVPASVRRALATADAMKTMLADLYKDGALIFVGFRHGDPDLDALLERVFGMWEPPAGVEHYFVANGLSTVDIEELQAEHHMKCLPLEGQPGSTDALVEWLGELATACEAAGVTLAGARPAVDDLEGWLTILEETPADADARAALLTIEQAARGADDHARLVEVLLARAGVEDVAEARVGILGELADTYEEKLGDRARALTAVLAALRDDPGNAKLLDRAEAMAAASDGWTELVADLAEVVPDVADAKVAARLYARLGIWYADKLRHADYALQALREALRRDPVVPGARATLEEVLRRQQKWGELADELAVHEELEPDAGKKISLLLSLGDLHESQLAQTPKAIDAYERALEVDAKNDDALGALERLLRRGEMWGKLAPVLERRAEVFEASDPARAGQLRKELAVLRSDKLGDLEGAIGRYEAALAGNAGDQEALRALVALYEKMGRTDDYVRTLERLAASAPESERAALLRRLAAEVEDREGGVARAIDYYKQVLALEPGAPDARRALERLYRTSEDWAGLATLLERQLADATALGARREVSVGLGRLYEKELADPHRAWDAWTRARELSAAGEVDREILTALGRLGRRLERWDGSEEAWISLATQLGERGAGAWHEAGEVAWQGLGDASRAEPHFAKALELEPGHLPSLMGLVDLHTRRKDWGRAARTMVDAERHSQNVLEKVRLLHDAAGLHADELGQPEKAVELEARVLALDPEHVEAGKRATEHWLQVGNHADAEPVLEMLARKAEDKQERARRLAALGAAAAAQGKHEKAEKAFRQAIEADGHLVEAALGLGNTLYAARELVGAEQQLRETLIRHKASLADGQVADLWAKIGHAARVRGELKTAEDAFRRALEREPGHAEAHEAIVELAREKGDWKAVVAAKRDALERLDVTARPAALEELGDLLAQRVKDNDAALGAYLEVLQAKPRAQGVLHKILEVYTEQKEWRRAVEVLAQLADVEKDLPRRAKYRYASAVIARDELKDADLAVEGFSQALDDAPSNGKAFEGVEQLLGERGDWRGLVRAYRKMIKRLGERATEAELLPLWTRLGDVAFEKLGDRQAALAAYEVALLLDPNDVPRHERLAGLYLEGGAEHADKAIAELQWLLRRQPEKSEHYRALSRLYVSTNQHDKAWCLAAALAFLGKASPEELTRFQAGRSAKLAFARRRLTEELWQKAVVHPREDRALNGVFLSLMGPFAATTAQPHRALSLDPAAQADVAKDTHPVARIFGYAAETLGLDPRPELYLREGVKEGIRAANVTDKGQVQPAVVIGEPYVGRKMEKDLAFDVARKLSYFRPERYVYYALPTTARLEAAVGAALGLAGGAVSGEAEKMVSHLRRTVPAAQLDQVKLLASRIATKDAAGAVRAWVAAADLTATRVGLILSGDLETAARLVATEQDAAGALNTKERLRELLAYSVSEEYFQVRRHLALEVAPS